MYFTTACSWHLTRGRLRQLRLGGLPSVLRGQDGGAFGATRALLPYAPGGLLRGYRLCAWAGVTLIGLAVATETPANGDAVTGSRTIPGCYGPALACIMKSTFCRVSLGPGADRRSGSGEGRADRGGCLDHRGQRGAARHRAEGHGPGLSGDAGALGPGDSVSSTPTADDLARLDRKRKRKIRSNQDWVSRSDPEAIDRQDEERHHAPCVQARARRLDLDFGAVVVAELHLAADEGSVRQRFPRPLAAAEAIVKLAVDVAPTAEDSAECVSDEGYQLTVEIEGARRRPLEEPDLRAQAEGFTEMARR